MDRIIKSLSDEFSKQNDLQNRPDEDQFEAFVASTTFGMLVDDSFTPTDYVIGSSGDLTIDIAGIIINGELVLDSTDVKAIVEDSQRIDVQFVFVQAKRSSSFESSVFTELASNLEHIFTSTQIKYPVNDDIKDLKLAINCIYNDINKLQPTLPRILVRYVTTGKLTDDAHLEEKRKAAETLLADTNLFSDVDVKSIDARMLRDEHQIASTSSSAEFEMIRKITLPTMPGIDQAFIGLLPARDIVRLVTDRSGGIRKSLFFDNVRDFQGYNPVNSAIQNSIGDPNKSKQFSVLNNGITIVTRSLQTAGDTFSIKDFQIVNGCQTCHVLFNEKEHISDDLHLSVRLIQSADESVISGITEATNRQTAVTDEDLNAQQQYHKDLEALFSSFEDNRKLYYERRSRQYVDHQIERTRIVTQRQLAKCFASMFLAEPARAGRYLSELLKARRTEIFNTDTTALAYYASAVGYYRIEWMLRNSRIDKKYSPTRYQLLYAIRLALLGNEPLPSSPRKTEGLLESMTTLLWDSDRSEKLVQAMLPVIDKAARSSSSLGELDRDTVKTRAFTEAVQVGISELKAQRCFDGI